MGIKVSGVSASIDVRTAAVWDCVRDAATQRARDVGRPLQVLDLGGGTGGLAVPLAALGHAVTVIDPSPDALASLRRRAAEVGVPIAATQGDTETLPDQVAPGSMDLVCCHGTLEMVDDPPTALRALAATLAPGAVLSLVAAGRLGAVISRALSGQVSQAQAILDSPRGTSGPDDLLRWRFDSGELQGQLQALGLFVQTHPVRQLSDLVPASALATDADRHAVLHLEESLGQDPRSAFLDRIGAVIHLLGHRPPAA